MKKVLNLVVFLMFFVISFSSAFIDLNVPESVGAGYFDNSNFIKISNKDVSYSYKLGLSNIIESVVSVNIEYEEPLKHNRIMGMTYINYDILKIGAGVWNSIDYPKNISDDSKEIYVGAFGMTVSVDGSLGNIIYGANFSYRLYNIISDEEGLNYYFQAFPEEIALLRGFSGHIGYNIFSNENMKFQFYLNIPGKYSILPGGFVFYRLENNYSFNVRLVIEDF